MNTQALHQLYNQAIAMFDQALSAIHELKTLEANDNVQLSDEEKKKRRRLKAIRWSIVFGISYAGYSFIRKWLRKRKQYREYMRQGGRNLLSQSSDNHFFNQHQQSHGLYAPSSYDTMVNDYDSGRRRYYDNRGYYNNRFDYQGYQPSYSHRQNGQPY